MNEGMNELMNKKLTFMQVMMENLEVSSGQVVIWFLLKSLKIRLYLHYLTSDWI